MDGFQTDSLKIERRFGLDFHGAEEGIVQIHFNKMPITIQITRQEPNETLGRKGSLSRLGTIINYGDSFSLFLMDEAQSE